MQRAQTTNIIQRNTLQDLSIKFKNHENLALYGKHGCIIRVYMEVKDNMHKANVAGHKIVTTN